VPRPNVPGAAYRGDRARNSNPPRGAQRHPATECPVTKLPRPTWPAISPSASSISYAAETVVRFSPSRPANSRVAGKRSTTGQVSRPDLPRKLLIELAVKRDFGFVNQRWRKIHQSIPYHIGLELVAPSPEGTPRGPALRQGGATIRFKAMKGFALVALACGVALVAWPAQKKKGRNHQTLQSSGASHRGGGDTRRLTFHVTPLSPRVCFTAGA